MRKNYTDITVLLDRSASMEHLRNSTIEGFNEFLKSQQKAEGDASLTLVQFSSPSDYSTTVRAANIKSVAPLNLDTYNPNGPSTAYLDALGKSINEVGNRLRTIPSNDRPEKVVFVVITDGLENSSREFTKSRIKEMIQHQESKYSWEFVFLGANMDAVSEGMNLGVKLSNSMTYTYNDGGMVNAYAAVSDNLVRYRGGLSKSMAFTDEDRKKQKEVSVTK